MVKWIKSLFQSNTPPCFGCDWISIEYPPEKGKRVLVKSKDGEINIGHVDTEVEGLWTAFMIEIGGKIYKFNIKEPFQWRDLPQ